jgi:Holliday junction DNA helicase RuvA
MIGMLTGKVAEVGLDWLIIDVAGVGYLVNIVEGEYLIDQQVKLHIHTAVRENDISLWGFNSKVEISLFNMLLSVSGVGLKTGMVLIRSLGVESIVSAILADNPSALKVSGVGLKTAEKIIIDLRTKINELKLSGLPKQDSTVGKADKPDEYTDIVDALVSLGYKDYEVRQALSRLEADSLKTLSTEALIKEILKQI